MSAQNPAEPAPTAQPARPVAIPPAEYDGGDETTPLLIYVVAGALGLVIFLGLLCAGLYLLGSVAVGHPFSDIFLTPTP